MKYNCKHCKNIFEKINQQEYCSFVCRMMDSYSINTSIFVNGDYCHEYTGRLCSDGYGSTYNNNKMVAVHRQFYIDKIGPISPGIIVRHKCDNRKCFNINHLELGTHQDNMNDMTIRKRSAAGEDHHNSKLSNYDVWIIRFHSLMKGRELAKFYNVEENTISRIRNNKSYKHVTQSCFSYNYSRKNPPK